MNKLLIVGITSVILFGASGTASWWLQHHKEAEHTPTTTPSAKGLASSAKLDLSVLDRGKERESNESMKAAVRPPYNPGSEEISRLTAELRNRIANARENERVSAAQKKELELIQQDIRGERASIDDLRKQVKKELELVQAALAELERQHGTMKTEQGKLSKSAQELEGKSLALQKDEQENLKKMSMMYNSMPAESAAKIMRSLADNGKMDTAVKVLGMMQERQAAKVLAELGDATLAVQLLERLKGLRRTSSTAEAGAIR